MGQKRDTKAYWSESALQVLFHMDTLCSIEQGRGVWVTSTALKAAMNLKNFDTYHINQLQGLVDSGVLEHRPGASFKPHAYRLSDSARNEFLQRFNRACAKCEIEK